MSTRDFCWGKGGRRLWLKIYYPCSAETSRKSGALTYPEPLGPPWPVAGQLYFTSLHFPFTLLFFTLLYLNSLSTIQIILAFLLSGHRLFSLTTRHTIQQQMSNNGILKTRPNRPTYTFSCSISHCHSIFFLITTKSLLTMGILSEKCVVRRFRRCANVIECIHTNLDSITY
jgi:hypothetical protein